MKTKISFILIAVSVLLQYPAAGQEKVEIKIDSLSKDVYMLTGRGGNIGIYVGSHYVFMIDDQFGHISADIKEAIAKLTDKPIAFLLNTHMHGDHTGGNANFNTNHTTIVAHDNARERVKDNQSQKLEKGEISLEYFNKMLPELTYTDHIKFYDGDEVIMAFHVQNAHTDGDTVVYFSKNNVLHMGDNYFAGRYPYIDLRSGGSVEGYIEAQRKALGVIDENTRVIPGHGRPSNRSELVANVEMLEDIKAKILTAINEGRSLEEIKTDSGLSEKYDDSHGQNYIKPDVLRETFYHSLKQ